MFGTAVHDFKHLQDLGLGCCGVGGAQRFLSDDGELHLADIHAHEMEHNRALHPLLYVVFVFCELELDVQAIVDAHLQDGRLNRGLVFCVSAKDHELCLFCEWRDDIPGEHSPHDVSHSAGLARIALVVLIEVAEPELVGFVHGEIPSGLQLF